MAAVYGEVLGIQILERVHQEGLGQGYLELHLLISVLDLGLGLLSVILAHLTWIAASRFLELGRARHA